MIYALGPDQADLTSDDRGAGLRRHERYGRFTFNMTQAVAGDLDPISGFPRPEDRSTNGAAGTGDEKGDHEYASYTHGLLMIAVFVLLFPLGTIWLRIFEKVRWHWINQVLSVILIYVAAAIGINLSRQYNRVRRKIILPQNLISSLAHFSDPRITVSRLQSTPSNHRLRPPRASPGPDRPGSRPSPHLPAPPATDYPRHPPPNPRSHRSHSGHSKWLLVCPFPPDTHCPFLDIPFFFEGGGKETFSLTHPFLSSRGFRFASTPRHIIGYIILIIIVAFLYCGAIFVHDRRRRRKAVYQTPAAQNFQAAYIPPEHQYDIPLAQGGGGGGGPPPPPPYSNSRPLGS